MTPRTKLEATRRHLVPGQRAVLALASLAIVGWATGARAALPLPDAVYYGNVTVNGRPASSGFVVSAGVGQSLLESYTVGSGPAGDGRYLIRVELQQPVASGELRPSGSAFSGEMATFKIGSDSVTSIALASGINRLDLTVTTGGTPPPTLTATPVVPPTSTPVVLPPTSTPTPTISNATPTPTGRTTPQVTPTGPAGSPTPTATPGACAGDCDNSSEVSIDELIIMVNVALETRPVSACSAGDADADGAITINEIIGAVSKALLGCTQ